MFEKPPKFGKDFLKGSSSVEVTLKKYVKSVKTKSFLRLILSTKMEISHQRKTSKKSFERFQ